MKKKLLFITPDHFDFYKVVLEGFEKYSGYDVTCIIVNQHHRDYKYKNALERIQNFFMKLFLKKNLKKIKINAAIKTKIDQHYDILFILRPDVLDEKVLKHATQNSKKSIVYYWDSFDKIKSQKATTAFFDVCYSFDANDCKKYNLRLQHNFHSNVPVYDKPIYDAHYIGTYDKRHNLLLKLIDFLNESHYKVHADLFAYDSTEISHDSHNNITFFNKIIPFPEVSKVLKNTKIIIDIHHDNQLGLSFRVFDAMGMKRKLISTNPNLKYFDFYNPNNIYIYSEDCKKMPDDFLTSDYQELDAEIVEKYSLKKWIETLINN